MVPFQVEVATYNVCWECMNGAGKADTKAAPYGKRCACGQRGRRNRCFRNVVGVLSHRAFDFIAIQEGSREIAEAVAAMQLRVHKEVYGIVTWTKGVSAACILFKCSKWRACGRPNAIVARVSGQECNGRLLMCQAFTGRRTGTFVHFASCHMPHGSYSLRQNLERLTCNANAGENLVVVGDFNRNVQSAVRVGQCVLRPCNRLPTAWNLKRTGYQVAVDNILVSKRCRLLAVQRLGDLGTLLPTHSGLLNYTSDHAALAARIALC